MDLRKLIAAPIDPPAIQERMNVLSFLAWSRSLDCTQRAEVAHKLARAYLAGRLCFQLKEYAKPSAFARLDALLQDAGACLAAFVQDPSTAVRFALAEALAATSLAPRHIVIALANDEPPIGATVVRQSPLLTDAELAELALAGDEDIQIALAQRTNLSRDISDLLIESARPRVAIALLVNSESCLSQAAFHRIANRFGDDREIRDALLARYDLPAPVRYDLVEAAFRQASAESLHPASLRRRIGQMTGVVRDRDLLRATADLEPSEIRGLVRHLRLKGALNIGILIRALVSGHRAFFEAAAIELSGLAPSRAAALARDRQGPGFRAIYRRMGLPAQYFTPIRAALAALDQYGAMNSGLVSREIISRVIRESERSAPELGHLLAFLHRLEAESLLDEGYDLSERAAAYNFLRRDEALDSRALFMERPPLLANEEEPLIMIGRLGEAQSLSFGPAYQKVA